MANGRGVRPKVCKVCGARAADGVVISFRALCPPCGERRMVDAIEQLAAHSGPHYDHYRERMRRTFSD